MGLKKVEIDGQGKTSENVSEQAEIQAVAESATQEHSVSDTEASNRHTQVAKKPPSNDVAEIQDEAEFSERMKKKRLLGMELGFGSFPIIKLANEGLFIDSEDNEHGKEFECILLSTRPSYLYKQKDNNDSPVSYSYDNINLNNHSEGGSTTVEELRSEWLLDDMEMERKDYLEGYIAMQGDSEFAGEMYLISIAPNSRRKIAGVMATAEFRGDDLNHIRLVCSVGAKRKHGSNTYFPWAFKMLRD